MFEFGEVILSMKKTTVFAQNYLLNYKLKSTNEQVLFISIYVQWLTMKNDLELVANADEAEFARLLFGVLVGDWVLKQLSNKFVFRFRH